MSLKTALIVAGIIFVILIIIYKLGRNKHCFRKAFLSMLSGIAALVAVNVFSPLTGVYLPVSIPSCLISIGGGVPGVIALLGINLVF